MFYKLNAIVYLFIQSCCASIECEQERQRAEDEKKKAEEEKRLRLLLEKDSAAVKDQLAKVLQRLGALENRQKSDKKEVEQIRNEVIDKLTWFDNHILVLKMVSF